MPLEGGGGAAGSASRSPAVAKVSDRGTRAPRSSPEGLRGLAAACGAGGPGPRPSVRPLGGTARGSPRGGVGGSASFPSAASRGTVVWRESWPRLPPARAGGWVGGRGVGERPAVGAALGRGPGFVGAAGSGPCGRLARRRSDPGLWSGRVLRGAKERLEMLGWRRL